MLLTALQKLTPFVEHCDYPRGYTAMTSMDLSANDRKQWLNLKHLFSTSPCEMWFNHLPYDKWLRLQSLTCVVSDLAARQRSLVAGLPGLKSIVILYRPDREPEWTLHRALDLCHALAPALTEVTVRVDPVSIHDECHLIRGRVDIDKQIDSMAAIQPVHRVRSLTLDLFDLDDQTCKYLTARYPSVMWVKLRVLHKRKDFSTPGMVEFMQINEWPCLKKLDLDISPFLVKVNKSFMYRFVGFAFNSLPQPRGFTERFQDDKIVDFAIWLSIGTRPSADEGSVAITGTTSKFSSTKPVACLRHCGV
ncbi:hypothetical protein BC940DRAFT_322789 [Gongronella butleri]|nr:hypothetical protein BC940DRAFT_322789 [Gongronella butleri]